MSDNLIYYSSISLNNTGADYRVAISERSGGKSYAFKLDVISHFWETGEKFAYIRRWKDEVTQKAVVEYFDDMELDNDGNRRIYELTNGEYDCIDVYARDIYLAKYNDDGKKVRGKQMGKAFALILDTKSKSRAYVNYTRGLFEEFITDEGYLPNEIKAFKSIVSTVFRRNKAVIYLAGNTLTPVCPYFEYWKVSIRDLKQGTITLIERPSGFTDNDGNDMMVKVAIEYPEPTGKPSQLFFDTDTMIQRGTWDTNDYPHLEGKLTDYVEWYSILFEYTQFRFWVKLLTDSNNFPFIYIYPCTKKVMSITNEMRVVSDRYSASPLWTKNFSQTINKYDGLVLDLLEKEKVVFSDDLTGTNFYQCINSIGGI